MDFETWMIAVDKVFTDACGLGRDDFPDNCYWDMWEGGMTPIEAARDTIENEGYNPDDILG